MKIFSLGAFLFLATLATRCESQTSDAADASDDHADADDAPEAAVDAAVPYPAPHPPQPTIRSLGGPVLAAPRVVPIVFENDPLAATIGAFTKALHGSQYWKATTSEYGVGDLTVEDTVVIPASDTVPAATITDEQVQAFLASHVASPDASTVYAVFYPQGTTITKSDGASCTAFGGYHRQVPLGATQVAYAVIPRCASFQSLSGADAVTAAASHEIVEAVTDPFDQSSPAYLVPDDDHIAYAFYPDTELADMCASESDSYFPADVGFMVQRSWSNALAAAGGSGCAPLPAGNVYWAASPVFTEKVNVDLTSVQMGVVTTHGVTVPVGQSKTIEVDVFSTAPTQPLNLWALDYPTLQGQPQELELTFDKPNGVNGDKRQLTIERVKDDPTWGGTQFIILAYTDTNHAHPTAGFVGQ